MYKRQAEQIALDELSIEAVLDEMLAERIDEVIAERAALNDPDDRTIVWILGSLLAIAVACVLVLAVRRRSDDDLAGVLEASRRLTASVDADEIRRIAVDECVALTGADRGAFVAVADDAADVLTRHGLDATSAEILDGDALAPVGRSNDGAVRRLATPVMVGDRIEGLFVVRRDGADFAANAGLRLARFGPMIGAALDTARSHASAAELALLDGLTGLPNRRGLDEDLAVASAETSVLVMVDVDHFKIYNDTNGHTAGDEALQLVAEVLSSNLRPGDQAYRYGGEEFCLLLDGVDPSKAQQVAERVRSAVWASVFPGGAAQPGGRVTISLGLAERHPDESVAAWLERADRALYEAKRNGRNRLVEAEG